MLNAEHELRFKFRVSEDFDTSFLNEIPLPCLMDPIIITLGQHRNEKAAQLLGQEVAIELRLKRQDCTLIENPETRTLMEIVQDLDTKSDTLSEEEIRSVLWGWEHTYADITRRPHEPYTFWFHGYSYNDNPQYLMDRGFKNFKNLGICPGDDLAYLIKYAPHDSGGGLVEIPEIWHEKLPPGHLEAAKRVLSSLEYQGYLLETNIEATHNRGWLGKEMVRTLTNGIDQIVRNQMHEILYD